MLTTKAEERGQYEMICIEELVPEDHILRKIDRAIDFSHIYELVGDLYCADKHFTGILYNLNYNYMNDI